LNLNKTAHKNPNRCPEKCQHCSIHWHHLHCCRGFSSFNLFALCFK